MPDLPPHALVAARSLTKKFGDNTAVDRLTFAAGAGEVFGILGPNGAGKTTTVRMLTALIAPTAGEASVAGHPLGKGNDLIRRDVGILTESPGLYVALSAERNLDFFAKLYGVADVPAQVEKYLKLLTLWERRHEPVSTFSKGMRQKLAIARALLHEPKVLFLDEPTSGLDPEMARLVREFIAEVKEQGRTIILCTHNLDEADRLCDTIAVLKTRLLALDTPKALRQQLFGRSVVFHLGQPAEPFAARLSGGAPPLKVRPVDNKLLVELDNPEEANPQIIRRLVESGADIQFVGEIRRSLEDIYLQLINRTKEENRG
jgi:ABC-2 type transport system ATP-binding protein